MTEKEFLQKARLEENVFELSEDCELDYLIHYAAPYTGSGHCLIPKGTAFAPHCPMREDAIYMHLMEKNERLLEMMKTFVKIEDDANIERIRKENPSITEEQLNSLRLYDRLQGFSFYITEKQLNTFPIVFRSGSKEEILAIMEKLRNRDYSLDDEETETEQKTTPDTEEPMTPKTVVETSSQNMFVRILNYIAKIL